MGGKSSSSRQKSPLYFGLFPGHSGGIAPEKVGATPSGKPQAFRTPGGEAAGMLLSGRSISPPTYTGEKKSGNRRSEIFLFSRGDALDPRLEVCSGPCEARYEDLCSSVEMRASNSSYAARNRAPSPASVLKPRARSFKSRLISLTSSNTAFIVSLNPSSTA
jgi:hypothetical protein